ncbi:MAG: hypothetical protein V4547_18910 [Bacteroidota bacterium]
MAEKKVIDPLSDEGKAELLKKLGVKVKWTTKPLDDSDLKPEPKEKEIKAEPIASNVIQKPKGVKGGVK